MKESEAKHWFELGKSVERSNRITLKTKEFWIGVLLGLLIMYFILGINN